MTQVKTAQEIMNMRHAGKILAEALNFLAGWIKPGIKTIEIDEKAREILSKYPGATAPFLGYQGFPATICVSVNDEVEHGIPGERVLNEGDIVGLDFGVAYKGMITDAGVTVGVGKISDEAQALIDSTKKSLHLGLKEVKGGVSVGDIGQTVQDFAEAKGYGVVRELVGHGVGYSLHEDPSIPNYGRRGSGPKLAAGMTVAIEPMLTTGDWRIKLDSDEWTFRTVDGSLAAHFEHTVLVTDKGCEILTQL